MTSRKGKDGAPLIQEFYQPDYSHTAPRAEGEAPTAPSGGPLPPPRPAELALAGRHQKVGGAAVIDR